MEELFKTFRIRFKDRDVFNEALEMNHLADDVGYSDMVLVYTNEFFRDRFGGFLLTKGVDIECD